MSAFLELTSKVELTRLFHCVKCGRRVSAVRAENSASGGELEMEVFCHDASEKVRIGMDTSYPTDVFVGDAVPDNGMYVGLTRKG